MTKVLVAFASKHGSTAEIASTIGEVLRSGGVETDVMHVPSANAPNGYNAVVLGSAVYAANWLSEAEHYLEKHETPLTERPVWLFSSGPTGYGDPVDLMYGWSFPDKLRPVADRIGPRDIALFHGHVDISKLSWGERLVVRSLQGAPGDFRDWDMIRAWAANIVASLVRSEA